MRARGAVAAALALAAASASACGDDGPSASSDAPAPGAARPTPSASADTGPPDSLDRWTTREVITRMAEAGLVVADSGVAPAFPPLTRSGDRVFVSGSELRLYVFDDAESRLAASAALDTVPPAAGYETTWEGRPRVILVNNLIALHFTPNDRLAERVDNVLRARHLGPR